jgi:cytochrome b561
MPANHELEFDPAGKIMSWRNSAERYGTLSIGLHWLMLLLLGGVYACINLSDLYPKGSDLRAALKTWHYMLGLAVFPLAWLRLAVHLASPVPRIEPAPPRWQQLSAKTVQVALYALMIGMPLLGWLIVSATGKPVPFFGLELPALVGESRSLEKLFKEIHETGGTVGYFLIGLHAAAALFHHYLMRDNTLPRMLPRRK